LPRRRGGHKLPSSIGKDMMDRALITGLVEENIAGTDMFIIDVEVKSGNIISVVLDSDAAVSIDKCADVNRFLCSRLESLSDDAFELSVYSAGLSEPLKLKRQYIKHIGKEIETLCKSGEKHRGILSHVDDESIGIEYTVKEKDPDTKKKKTIQKNMQISIDSIKSTKLVIKV
jgi:ribosome maturation factor RimP